MGSRAMKRLILARFRRDPGLLAEPRAAFALEANVWQEGD